MGEVAVQEELSRSLVPRACWTVASAEWEKGYADKWATLLRLEIAETR
jgi:hypothetical protein